MSKVLNFDKVSDVYKRQTLNPISAEASFSLSKFSSTDVEDLPIIFKSSVYLIIYLDLI